MESPQSPSLTAAEHQDAPDEAENTTRQLEEPDSSTENNLTSPPPLVNTILNQLRVLGPNSRKSKYLVQQVSMPPQNLEHQPTQFQSSPLQSFPIPPSFMDPSMNPNSDPTRQETTRETEVREARNRHIEAYTEKRRLKTQAQSQNEPAQKRVQYAQDLHTRYDLAKRSNPPMFSFDTTFGTPISPPSSLFNLNDYSSQPHPNSPRMNNLLPAHSRMAWPQGIKGPRPSDQQDLTEPTPDPPKKDSLKNLHNALQHPSQSVTTVAQGNLNPQDTIRLSASISATSSSIRPLRKKAFTRIMCCQHVVPKSPSTDNLSEPEVREAQAVLQDFIDNIAGGFPQKMMVPYNPIPWHTYIIIYGLLSFESRLSKQLKQSKFYAISQEEGHESVLWQIPEEEMLKVVGSVAASKMKEECLLRVSGGKELKCKTHLDTTYNLFWLKYQPRNGGPPTNADASHRYIPHLLASTQNTTRIGSSPVSQPANRPSKLQQTPQKKTPRDSPSSQTTRMSPVTPNKPSNISKLTVPMGSPLEITSEDGRIYRICSKQKRYLPRTEFDTNPRTNKPFSHCKTCRNTDAKGRKLWRGEIEEESRDGNGNTDEGGGGLG